MTIQLPIRTNAGLILNQLFPILSQKSPLDSMDLFVYNVEKISVRKEIINNPSGTKFILKKDIWGISELFLVLKDYNGIHLVLSHVSKSMNDFGILKEYIDNNIFFVKTEDDILYDTYSLINPDHQFPQVESLHFVFRKGLGMAEGFDISVLVNFKKIYLANPDLEAIETIDLFNAEWNSLYKMERRTTKKEYFIDGEDNNQRELKKVSQYCNNQLIFEEVIGANSLVQTKNIFKNSKLIYSLEVVKHLQFGELKEFTYENNLLVKITAKYIPFDHGNSSTYTKETFTYDNQSRLIEHDFYLEENEIEKQIINEYDLSGRLLSIKTTDTTWDKKITNEQFEYNGDKISRITIKEDNCEEPNKVEEFKYDNFANLTHKRVLQYGKEYVHMLHFVEKELLKEEKVYQDNTLVRIISYDYIDNQLAKIKRRFLNTGIVEKSNSTVFLIEGS